MTGVSIDACRRPGCGGAIDDGYCDECGHPAAGAGPGGGSGPAPADASGPGTAAAGPPTGALGPPTGAAAPPTGAGTGALSPSDQAARLGVVERPDVLAAGDRVHDLLWTRPCDLAAATVAVVEYQRLIRDGG